MIQRIHLNDPTSCRYCMEPLRIGELAYRDERTHVIGCCHACCQSAAQAVKLDNQKRILIGGMRHSFSLTTGG